MIFDGRLQLGDGTKLPMQMWLPDHKTPLKAVIIALHGFNDYSKSFGEVGRYFKQRGVAFFAYDQRGFGRVNSHGVWAGEANLTEDLRQATLVLKKAYPHVPMYLLGESMGGAVVISAQTRSDFPKVDGLILSAPAIWGNETMNGFYRMTLWTLAHTIPAQQVTGGSLKILASDNIPMLRDLGRDPLVVKSTRIDAIYGVVSLMDSAYGCLPDVKTPMLFLYGNKDQVIPRAPFEQASARLTAPHVMVYYPKGYHMLLRDWNSEMVLKDIMSWIEDKNRPLPSGFDKTKIDSVITKD